MRHALRLHPESHCDAAIEIAAEAARPHPGALTLRYVVNGAVAGLSLPSAADPVRTDGLWRHTCFEAFVRARDGDAYYEFNVAPSTQWAAYRFDFYRTGMAHAPLSAAPRMETVTGHGRYEMRVSLAVGSLAGLPRDAPWRLGLSAVIEVADGGLSHWALAHPAGKADFHHSDCFALELAAA